MSRGAHLHSLSLAASSGSPARASCRATNSSMSQYFRYAHSTSSGVISRFIRSFRAACGERMTRDAAASLFPIADATVNRVVRSPEAVELPPFNNAMGIAMRESLKPKPGQPGNTAGNRERSEFALEFLTTTQLASFTAIKVMDEVMCANALDDQSTAKLIGKSKGDFSKVRRARIDDMCRTISALTRIKGHAGLIQKIAHDAGITLLRPRRKGGRV